MRTIPLLAAALISTAALAQQSPNLPARTPSTWVRCDTTDCLTVNEAIDAAVGHEVSTRTIERNPATSSADVAAYKAKLTALRTWAAALPDSQSKTYYLLLIDRRQALADTAAAAIAAGPARPSAPSIPKPPANIGK